MTDPKQHSFSNDDVLEIAEGNVFGDNAPKLPLPNMLMIDRITQVTEDGGAFGRGYIEAELDIRPDLWFFDCHFRGDPVMPGCLGLDALWQLTGFFLAWSGFHGKGRALGVKDLRFVDQVLPTNRLVTYHINIRRVINRKLVMVLADGSMDVDGKEIYTAEKLQVGLFIEDDPG